MATILVIEDERLLRENLLSLLEFEGYSVLEAEDGQRGLDLATEHHPDLVICDIAMPVMDGYEVLSHLRNVPETRGIPLIFLTARAGKTAIKEGLESGAISYITKPFSFADLLGAIRSILDA